MSDIILGQPSPAALSSSIINISLFNCAPLEFVFEEEGNKGVFRFTRE